LLFFRSFLQMPLLKGASSDFTHFVKFNAQAFPAGSIAPKVVATSAPAPKLSLTSVLTRASAVAALVSPRTKVTAESKPKSTR
jgi:hypothetical protein